MQGRLRSVRDVTKSTKGIASTASDVNGFLNTKISLNHT